MDESDDRWDAAQEGAELVAEGESERAIIVLGELLLLQPNNEHAHFYLGCAHFELGAYDKALKAYVTALSLAPNYLGAMVHAAHTLRMLGRADPRLRRSRWLRAPVDRGLAGRRRDRGRENREPVRGVIDEGICS